MAKGAFLSVKRGKLGDSVGYNVSNSNNKERQGWRIYQPVVKNPQTDAQIDQRLKLAAVNNLYRAIKEVVLRGQENKEYGDPSRRAWLSRALATADVPVLKKGSIIAAPIRDLPIMYGSLPSLPLTWDGGNEYFFFSSVVVNAGADLSTVGGISSILIDAGYKKGDQLTIVYARQYDDYGVILWDTIAVYLDPTDTSTWDDVAFGLEWDEMGDRLAFSNFPNAANLSDTAVAVSISRDGDAVGSHLRSTSYLALGANMEREFYGLSAAEVQARKETYRRKRAASDNWQQVPGGDQGGGGGAVLEAETLGGGRINITAIRNRGVPNADILLVDDNGAFYYVQSFSQGSSSTFYLQGSDNADGYTTGSSSYVPSGQSNANTVNPCSSVNVALGVRAWLIAQGVPEELLYVRG